MPRTSDCRRRTTSPSCSSTSSDTGSIQQQPAIVVFQAPAPLQALAHTSPRQPIFDSACGPGRPLVLSARACCWPALVLFALSFGVFAVLTAAAASARSPLHFSPTRRHTDKCTRRVWTLPSFDTSPLSRSAPRASLASPSPSASRAPEPSHAFAPQPRQQRCRDRCSSRRRRHTRRVPIGPRRPSRPTACSAAAAAVAAAIRLRLRTVARHSNRHLARPSNRRRSTPTPCYRPRRAHTNKHRSRSCRRR